MNLRMTSRPMMLHAALILSMLTVASQSAFADPEPEQGCYLFSYFRNNGEDGLHFASSSDGLKWESLNDDKSFTSPTVGGKLMSDPSIVQGPDGVFHMVWSSGWWDLGFGYASSRDLIHWSEHRLIPVNQDVAGAKNTWAPDLFFDQVNEQFVILFATTIPGRFPETDNGGDHNHRMYWVKTKDFVTFSKPELAFDPGYNCIDATLVKMNDGITMIFKDERPGHKRLHVTTAAGIGKPWSAPGEPILKRDWVEGPTALKVGPVWRLYFDCYKDGHYGAAESRDGKSWTDITDKLQMPKGMRHGTAFSVSPEIYAPLLKYKTTATNLKN